LANKQTWQLDYECGTTVAIVMYE